MAPRIVKTQPVLTDVEWRAYQINVIQEQRRRIDDLLDEMDREEDDDEARDSTTSRVC